MEEIVYKLTTLSGESYMLGNFPIENAFSLKYELKKTTKMVKDTVGIMCFNKRNAIKFAKNIGFPYRLLKAKGIRTKIQAKRISGFLGNPNIRCFYSNEQGRYLLGSPPPYGTIFCREIIPMEIVK